MSDGTGSKLVSKQGIIIDLILTAVWFVFFTFKLRPYVPAQSEVYVSLFALLTAACLAGVFWLALSMFRVVFVDQRRGPKGQGGG